MAIPPMERFMRFVNKTDSCWLWTGTTSGTNARYGYFNPTTSQYGKKVPSHRWLYEQMIGPIPPGMELDHVADRGCASKLCVNPDHLEPVTHAENRRRSRLKVCRRGLHDLTQDANVRWDTDGNRRGCKPCWVDRARERRV